MKELSKEDYKELASQLRNPSGENGTEMGHVMNETNMTMTKETISNLSLVDNDIVLELGHGNGHHIKDLLTQATNLSYIGLDISPLMNETRV
ncbi:MULTISPECIES: class I SAM-dependent methyltransferase [Flavobacterium]|uniref:Methyltransferase domain-containing protein n=1 Tax=Flavobacterium jumunjinense TaxID=998845 RepID=A0ABV5GNH4_9FLAO|nr:MULTISPECIES: class I SAM-dependent methyltransferase [Flavobacterium]